MCNLDSTTDWDQEVQREFWNRWVGLHLQDETLGTEALRRGQVVISLLRGLNLSKPNIIELGCGNGWLAEKLAAFGPITGVDIADSAIEEARRRVPHGVFYSGDALSLNLPVRTFDVVVTLETFSHVPNQALFVELMARTLTSDGYLILLTQNRTIYTRRRDIAPPGKGLFRRWVTMSQLRKMLLPYFHISTAFTIQPSGNRGLLRIVNSNKLNRLLTKFLRRDSLERFKERCGLGQTLVVVGQKRRDEQSPK
jgi:ubiquinone/menaquinone biosynthesis C-methylase UbiE